MGLYFNHLLMDVATAVALLWTSLYLIMRLHIFAYWQRRNIPFLDPTFPFGNFGDTFLARTSIGELIQQVYEQSSEKVIGIFGMHRPILVVRDPELVRAIFIKDFAHFSDRGVYIDEERDPLSGHLFSLSGEKWKNLRTKLSPVFTTGKLKAAFGSLLGCGKTLTQFIRVASEREDVIEVREISARFNTDIIASVAFGIDINSMDNPETEFRLYGRKAFELSVRNGLRALSMFVMPVLNKALKMRTVDDDVEKFMMTVVRDTMEYRQKNNVTRKDLFQLLLQLRNTGQIAEDDDWDATVRKSGEGNTLTFNEMAAQAWVFYAAGFETSSSTMSFCMYELARNPDCQRKVQAEIDAIDKKYNGEITYDSIADMKYLECCIDETLRMYPIVPIMNRECTRDYQFPGTKYRIEKGTAVFIPVLGMQRDPQFYPEPEQFRPDRFANKTEHSFVQQPYMSFGEGPRICIGMRLAKIQVKIGLYQMLQQADYQLAHDMPARLQLSAKSFVLAADGGIRLRVTRRK